MDDFEECSPFIDQITVDNKQVELQEKDQKEMNTHTSICGKMTVSKLSKKYFIKACVCNFQHSLAGIFCNRKYVQLLNKFEISSVLLDEDTKLISFSLNEFVENSKSATVFEVLWSYQLIFHAGFALACTLFACLKFANACFLVFIMVLLMILLLFHPVLERLLRYNRLADSILGILDAVEAFNSLSRKVTLFVQEADIVARGFVFVSNNNASTAAAASNTDGLTRRCPQLRCAHFTALRRMVYQLRDATCTLHDHFLTEQCQDLLHCIAHIPLADFGPCLSLPDSDESGLAQVSDDFSLASLKAMNELAAMHCSELLRKLCVCAHPEAIFARGCETRAQDVLDVIAPCHSVLLASRHALKKKFDLHQFCLEQNPAHKEAFERGLREQSEKHRRRLFVAVHSLNLHLQAALLKVFEMEKLLGMDAEAGGAAVAELDRLQQVVSAELDAAGMCLEESHASLHGSTEQDQSEQWTPQTHLNAVTTTTATINNNNNSVTLICDPVIEDDVLEALVKAEDASDDEECAVMSSESACLPEAQQVLLELRTVIGCRAREWRARERRAARRRAGLPDSPCLSSDEEDKEEKRRSSTYFGRSGARTGAARARRGPRGAHRTTVRS